MKNMKKIAFYFFILIHSGYLNALTKNEVLSVQNGIYYLDGAPFAEIGWNKFDINWLFFAEVYANRTLTDNNSRVVKQRNSMRELSEAGFKTIRFFGMVHPSDFQEKWLPAWNNTNQRNAKCNAPMDKAIAICEEFNIRAVISLMADNFVNTSVVPAEDYKDLIANRNSQSRKDLYAYLDYVITRYKDRKGVLAWEVSNEMTLDVDINPGTRIASNGERRPTAAELSQFYKDVCARIKGIDNLRMVTSGGSVLREMAYGLSQLPQTETVSPWPARDTYNQHKSMYGLYYTNSGFENVDIHFYTKKAPNYQILNNNGQPLQLTAKGYNDMMTSLGVPLMIGEYGALPKVDKTNKMYWLTGDDWFTTFENETDTAQMYVQEACDNAVNSGCRLIYWWCYDSHRPQDQNDRERMDLDKVRTPILFQKVVDANRRLKQKFNITSINEPSIQDRKLWFSDGKLCCSSDYIGKHCRVYNVQGVLLQQFISANSIELKYDGLLLVKVEDKTIKIFNSKI